ncbi:glycan biosynthesis hexose transferase WsfD [Blastococcus mobilis]|nr:hypothetical protein [Blastococcus mobilis]
MGSDHMVDEKARLIDAPGSVRPYSGEGPSGPRTLHRLGVALLAGVLAVVVVALATGLMTGRPVGVTDNGDGVRLFCGAGLVPATPTGQANWAGGVVLDFVAGGVPCPDPAPSSALALLDAAVGGAAGPWALTELGWLYALAVAGVTVLGAWAATAGGLLRAAVLVPPLVPLGDADFSRFFLSTYGEPAGMLGTYALCVGTAAVAVTCPRHRAARGMALLLVAAGGLLAATAKTAYAPVLAVAVLVCVLTSIAVPGRPRRWAHLAGPALAAVLLAASVAPLASAQAWQARHYAWVNTHNLVFTLVLPEVGPEAATAVGLPAEANSHAGRAYYPDGPAGVPGAEVIAADPEGVRNAAWRTLVRHPDALLQSLGIALQSTADRELDYLAGEPWTPATRPSRVVAPVGAQAATAESLHRWLDEMSRPWWPSLLAAAGMALGGASFRIRSPLARGLGRLSGLAAVTAVGLALVAVLGDGFFEIAKHTWLSAYLLDVALWAAAGTLAVAVMLPLRRATARGTSRTVR